MRDVYITFFISWLIPGRVHAYELILFMKVCFSKHITSVGVYTFSFGGPYCPHILTCLYQYVRMTERFMEEAMVAYLKFHRAIESD